MILLIFFTYMSEKYACMEVDHDHACRILYSLTLPFKVIHIVLATKGVFKQTVNSGR